MMIRYQGPWYQTKKRMNGRSYLILNLYQSWYMYLRPTQWWPVPGLLKSNEKRINGRPYSIIVFNQSWYMNMGICMYVYIYIYIYIYIYAAHPIRWWFGTRAPKTKWRTNWMAVPIRILIYLYTFTYMYIYIWSSSHSVMIRYQGS